MEINFNLTAERPVMPAVFSKELLAVKIYPVPHCPVSVKTKEIFPIDAGIWILPNWSDGCMCVFGGKDIAQWEMTYLKILELLIIFAKCNKIVTSYNTVSYTTIRE